MLCVVIVTVQSLMLTKTGMTISDIKAFFVFHDLIHSLGALNIMMDATDCLFDVMAIWRLPSTQTL